VSFEVRTTIKELKSLILFSDRGLTQLISRKAATHALLVIIFPTQTLITY